MATRRVNPNPTKILEDKISKWRDEGRKLQEEIETYLYNGVKKCPNCDEILEEGDTRATIDNLTEIRGKLDAFIDNISCYI